MTWLFVRFYLAVLLVLLLAYFVHGTIWLQRYRLESARIIETAHGGGARLVAEEVSLVPPGERDQVLARLCRQLGFPVQMVDEQQLPNSVRRTLRKGKEIVYFQQDLSHCLAVTLTNSPELVLIGPFPDYSLRGIEDSIRGWMRIISRRLNKAPIGERDEMLKELRERFDLNVEILPRDRLPALAQERLEVKNEVVFYLENPDHDQTWFSVTSLDSDNGDEVVRVGPFPSFRNPARSVATTTLAFVLLPTALAIALLLRPVARQLQRVEKAAKSIAEGDLSARVDVRRVRSTKPLAVAFNNMAQRTEMLVRTQRELLQAVSHELRTPLSRIKFAIELIGTAKDEVERAKRLEALDVATDELNELVGELLKYVRMETVESTLEREPIEPIALLQTIVSRYASLHPSIRFDVDESVTNVGDVMAERAGLQRVLGNLLNNAGRFAKSLVRVSAHRNDDAIIIEVEDDGPGIPESERESVLEPFTRLASDAASRGGVGLGLALVKRTMVQHGGSVEVLTSDLGGCKIRTTWPLTA